MRKILFLTFLTNLISYNSFGQDIYTKSFEGLSKRKFIAVGESVHATEDFANWNINFFKELVQNGISTTLAIESNYSQSKAINRYIKGEIEVEDLDSLMNKSLYSIWISPSMREFIIWARNYNHSHEAQKQISFIGFDSHYAPGAIDEIKSYLDKNHPDYSDHISSKGMKLLSEMEVTGNYNLKRLPEEDRQLLEKTVRDLNTFFEAKVLSTDLINLDLMVVNHAWEYQNANPFNFTSIRDRNMFLVLEEITKSRSKPVVIWGHNGHISKSTQSFYKPLGYHLSKKYKSEYLSIGLDFKNKANSSSHKPLEDRDWIANMVDFGQDNIKVIKMNSLGNAAIRHAGADNGGSMKLNKDKQFDYLVYFEELNN